MRTRSWPLLAGAALFGVLAPTSARATSGFDLGGDTGVAQLGRGSAWIVRADDPLASYYNPASLASQKSGVTLGAHVMFARRCFARTGPDGQPVSPGQGIAPAGTPGASPGTACLDEKGFLNPQIGAAFRLSDRFAVGLAVLGPHGIGKLSLPTTIPDSRGGQQPNAARFMLDAVDPSSLFYLSPSVAYAVNDRLAFGAAFVWGIFMEKGSLFAETSSPAPAPGQQATDDFYAHGEAHTSIDIHDYFVPGFVLSGKWSPAERVDVAGAFHWQDAIRFGGSVETQSRYFNADGSRNANPCGPGEPSGCNVTKTGDQAIAGKFPVPWEIRAGVLYHQPRPRADAAPKPPGGKHVRDPMHDDEFDLELDLTFARNSMVQTIDAYLPGSAQKGGSNVPIAGTTNATIPSELHFEKYWHDEFGVRLGGDYVVEPDVLSLRAGGFYESQGGRPEYLNIHFFEAMRGGVSCGATIRIAPVDLSFAYQHTFFGVLDNQGGGLVHGLSGDATSNHQTQQVVNNGRMTGSMNEVGLAGTVRW